MPCSKSITTYRPQEWGSEADFIAHREATLKLLLGEDWQDQSLVEIVQAHPELWQSPIFLHHVRDYELPRANWQAQMEAQQRQAEGRRPRSHPDPLAIEGGPRMSAHDWLKAYLRASEGVTRED